MGFRGSQLLPAPALDGSFVSAGQEVMRMSQEIYDSLYAACPSEMVVARQRRWGMKQSTFGEAMRMLGRALRSGTRKHQFDLLSKEKAAPATVRVVCHLQVGKAMPHSVFRWGFFFHTSYLLIWNIAVPGGCAAWFQTLPEHCYISLIFAFTCLNPI